MLGTSPSRAVRCNVAAATLLLVGACAADPATQQSPSEPPELGTDSEWSRQQRAVIDAVDGYNDWYRDSLTTPDNPRLDLRTLRAVATGAFATEQGRQMSIAHEQGVEMRGEYVFDHRDVTVEGDRAVLTTCWDSRDGDVFITVTKPAERVKPAPPTLTSFTLQRADGAWKITDRKGKGRC